MKIKITKLPNKKAYGGPTNKLGGDFSNNVVFINEGGTHENNPLGGVPLGKDSNSNQNLVEEGEVIWNDYVFSNRLTPNKKILKNGGFSEKYADWTFAKIAEEFQKESAERPNDPISKRGLQDSMQRLIGLQEEVRNKKGVKKEENNQFPHGGWTDDDSYAREEEEMAALWDAADEEMQRKVDGANRVINGSVMLNNPDVLKAFPDLLKPNTSEITTTDSDTFDWGNLADQSLRMAPLFTNIADLARNLKKPDYTEGDRVLQVAENAPISNITANTEDINLRPVDFNYLANKVQNQGNALLSNIANQSGNAQQAMYNMILANAQNQSQVADALYKGMEINTAGDLQEAEFNRGNRQFETQTDFQNFANNMQRHQGIVDATKYSSAYNTQVDASRAQGISGASGNMATSLAGIGSENFWKRAIDKNPYILYDTTGTYKNNNLQNAKVEATATTRKNGGRLLTKKRRNNYGK